VLISIWEYKECQTLNSDNSIETLILFSRNLIHKSRVRLVTDSAFFFWQHPTKLQARLRIGAFLYSMKWGKSIFHSL
jgi:hypothetical protein